MSDGHTDPREAARMLKSIFGTEALARMLNVSRWSVWRYTTGRQRPRPLVAARLACLSAIVADLEKYRLDAAGIRRWFSYGSELLGYRSPAEIFLGSWDPRTRIGRLRNTAYERYAGFAAELAARGIATTIPPSRHEDTFQRGKDRKRTCCRQAGQ